MLDVRPQPDHNDGFLRADHVGPGTSRKANRDKIAVFDMFFRRVPDGGGYAIMAGLQQFMGRCGQPPLHAGGYRLPAQRRGSSAKNFSTTSPHFKLHCNIWAIEEGRADLPAGAHRHGRGAPAIECQLLETLLLVTFNHQCLIATKSNRNRPRGGGAAGHGIRRPPRPGVRRPPTSARRAAYIGGCGSTSCVMAARDFRHPGVRHHGPCLGADVPQRV